MNFRDIALLAARLILGILFVAHGWQKLNSWGIDGVQESFAGMGVPAPEISAYIATFAELIGGIMLIAGLALPVVAVVLSFVMAGAAYYAHIDAGFWNTDGGYEWPLALIAGLLAVGFAKAGPAAADTYLFSRFSRK